MCPNFSKSWLGGGEGEKHCGSAPQQASSTSSSLLNTFPILASNPRGQNPRGSHTGRTLMGLCTVCRWQGNTWSLLEQRVDIRRQNGTGCVEQWGLMTNFISRPSLATAILCGLWCGGERTDKVGAFSELHRQQPEALGRRRQRQGGQADQAGIFV